MKKSTGFIPFLQVIVFCFLSNFTTYAGNNPVATTKNNPTADTETESKAFQQQKVGLVFNFKSTSNATVFNEQDARQLQRFMTQKISEYSCDSKNAMFISANYSAGVRTEVDLVDDLEQLGYVVLDLECQNARIVFSISKKNNQLVYAKSAKHLSTNESSVDDCGDCGKVKLSDSLLNKFKNEDYGGEAVIDFGDDAGFGSDADKDDN